MPFTLLFIFNHFLFFLRTLVPAILNNANPANVPASASSPVFTLTVVSPLFTGVFTALSVVTVCNPARAFARTSFALSTSSCVAFGFSYTAFASFNAFVNPSNDAFV